MPKTDIARSLGISRSAAYYSPKLPPKDWALKIRIEELLHQYPSYGHRRLALLLHLNKKRVLRVMNLFGIRPYRRRGKKPWKTRKSECTYPNLLLREFPVNPHHIWVSDFTHLKWNKRWIYLATVMDLYSRIVVGWYILNKHSTDLVAGALNAALKYHPKPDILHSDQGSEYASRRYGLFVGTCGIKMSMSRKSSPWENGYQESFYSQFKVDLGDPERFQSLGELAAAIHYQIFFYNNYRIHTALKMPPALYARRHEILKQRSPPTQGARRESV